MRVIAEAPNFSGFLTASDIENAIENNTYMNISLGMEDVTDGNILRSQEQFEEPQGNSTLLEPAEVSVELVEDGNSESPAGRVGPEPAQTKQQKRAAKQRRYRQWKTLTKQLSKLSTNPTGQGNREGSASGSSITDAEPRSANPQPSGRADSIAAKRGRTSPGANPQSKRLRRREETQPGLSSYANTTRKNLFLSIIPLDLEGSRIGATDSDRLFLTEVLERFIAANSPNLNIDGLSLNGDELTLRSLDQKTLEVVKKVVCPLKGPESNLKGYLCLAPKDKPPRTTFYVWAEEPLIAKDQFINVLKDKNNWIDPKKLTVKTRIPKPSVNPKGATYVIGVESEMETELKRRKFNIRYGVGRSAIFKKSKRQLTRGGEAPQQQQ